MRLRLPLLGLAAAGVYAAGSGLTAAGATRLGPRSVDADAASTIGGRREDVSFRSRDGVTLRGWLFHPEHPDGSSAILVHGWHANRVDQNTVPLARHLLERGSAVLLFDMRGSGESGGARQTFATEEPRDVLGAHDHMLARGYDPARMTIIGDSMGGAAVIGAAPDLGDVAALVCDSAFARLRDAVAHSTRTTAHLPGWLSYGALQLGRPLGVDPRLAPIDVVRSLPERAFLFITTTDDERVRPADSVGLRRASANPGSVLLLVRGRGHLQACYADPALYFSTLDAFIDSQQRQAVARGGVGRS